MKLAQGLLLSLVFASMAGANEVTLSWQWQSVDGQQKHLLLNTDERVISASRHEMSLLDASSTIRWRPSTPTSVLGSTTASI